MAWIKEDSSGDKGPKKPSWNYKQGVDFLTVLDGAITHLALLTGPLDPTGTWEMPESVWIHQYKAGGKFITHISDRYNVACPLAFENELYKLRNPNYKQNGGRLPYPLSKKAILQVYSFDLKRVFWFLAGNEVQEGMEFILENKASEFKGIVSINRKGSGLKTKYRVDVSSKELTDEDKAIIAGQIKPLSFFFEVVKPFNEAEFLARTGINATAYFQANKQNMGLVDMTTFGDIPGGLAGVGVGTDFKGNAVPVAQPQATQVSATTATPSGDWQAALLTVVESESPFKGKTLREVFQTTGEPYLKYMVNTNTKEAGAAKLLLENLDAVKAALAA